MHISTQILLTVTLRPEVPCNHGNSYIHTKMIKLVLIRKLQRRERDHKTNLRFCYSLYGFPEYVSCSIYTFDSFLIKPLG